MSEKNTRKKKVEQNNPKGAILHSVKSDLMCGGIHQISVFRPTIIIDSHMHIQSGRCAPLQFIQNVSILTRNRTRKWIEDHGIDGGATIRKAVAVGHVLEQIFLPANATARTLRANREKKYNDGQSPPIKEPLRELTEQSIKSTLVIGDDFMKQRNIVYNDFLRKEKLYARLSNLVFSCVIMTMDMEYAHVDGYYGLKIYNALYNSREDLENLKPCDYWTPVHGRWEIIYSSSISEPGQRHLRKEKSRGPDQYTRTDKGGTPEYSEMKADYVELEKKASEEFSLYGSYYDNKKKKTVQEKVHAVPVLTSKEETDTYEHWEKQLKYTELAMLKYPLKLLSLYHYDPRRYQPKGTENGNVIPLGQVTGHGLYLGFKMYTAQGYRPWDPRLPILEDFYFRCCKGDIPILNHCTPGGAASFEKEEYFNFKHPNDTAEDRKQKAPQPRKLVPLNI